MSLKEKIKKSLRILIQKILIENRRNLRISPERLGLTINQEGHLCVGGCDSIDLGTQYGTPLFIINGDGLRRQYRSVRDAFNSNIADSEISYSYKTNPIPAVLSILHEEGAGASVISDLELKLAFQLGVAPQKIIFNGLSKSEEGLNFAMEKGIGLINIDSFEEINRIEKITGSRSNPIQIKVGIRLNLSTGCGNQFGFSINNGEAHAAAKKIRSITGVKLVALHFHLGSGIQSPMIYRDPIRVALRFGEVLKSQLHLEIEILDIGGGFGVPTVTPINRLERMLYKFDIPLKPPDTSRFLTPFDFAKAIGGILISECETLRLKVPRVWIEPGRLLTSSAQILLLKVGCLKDRPPEPTYIILEGGLNIITPLSSGYYEAFIANRMKEEASRTYRVVGPPCSASNAMYHAKFFPDIQIGDFLAIVDTGAYFVQQENNITFPRPAVVIASQGQSRIVRKRETLESMLQLDTFSG